MSDTGSTQVPLGPDERADVEAAGLGHRSLMAVDAAGAGIAIIAETSSADMLDDWQRARDVLPSRGRRPVLWASDCPSSGWKDSMLESDPFGRFFFREGMVAGDPSPAGVLSSADRLDVDASFLELERRQGQTWQGREGRVVESELQTTRRLCGIAPDESLVRAAIAAAPDPGLAADRFLFEWELENGCEASPGEGGCWHLDPYDPTESGSPVGLVLLPTPHPWAVHAYIHSLYDASWYGQDLVVAAAHRWYDDFGAEPVALWGTMIQMLVTRPPSESMTAWRVAREQSLLAQNTIYSAGFSVREHARCLLGRRDWFLHSRP